MTTGTTLQPKFEQLSVALNAELIERGTIIDTQIMALIAGVHHFQIGVPGVAKSLSVRKMVSHIDGLGGNDYFETLVTKFSNPEEIFGPLDLLALQGLRNETTGEVLVPSTYRFQTDGYAPEAKIWFLDEIWKGNAAILNALLMALNERLFRNEGHVQEIPLWTMYCASNEMPEGEELNALYDRIHFRHIVRPIQEPASFINMLKLSSGDQYGKVVSWDEVLQAQSEAAEVEIPDEVWEALNKIRMDLRAEEIEPTDRRFRECGKIIRAKAWLEGEEVADIEHMRPLSHVLWTTPDEQPKVEGMLRQLANPLEKEAQKLEETVQKIASELDKVAADKDMDPQLRNKKGVELHGKVEKAKKDLQKLAKQMEGSKRKSQTVEEVKQLLVRCATRLLQEIFVIPPGETQVGI